MTNLSKQFIKGRWYPAQSKNQGESFGEALRAGLLTFVAGYIIILICGLLQ